MHQAGFQEVLSSAQLTDDLPEELILIGAQPELLDDYGGSLRDSVKAQIDPAIQVALEILAGWNITALPRDKLPDGSELIGPGALDLQDYEDNRPLPNGEIL
jgi:hydrogenase maturation protease